MMSIAWFHSHIQNWAGGTKFLFETVKRLNRKASVTLFVEAASPEILRMFEAENVRVVILTKTRSSKSKLYWLLFPHHLARETEWVRKNVAGFDVYVSSMFPMNVILMNAGKRPHICFCFEPFAFFHDRDMIQGFRSVNRAALKILARLHADKDIAATRSADEVLAIHDGIGKWISKIYGRQAVYTYLGVDTETFRHCEDNRLCKKFAGRTVIIHSTDYTPLKRTWFLIKAMAEIVKKAPEALLLVTHSQEDRSEQKTMKNFIRENGLENNVRLLGFVDYDDLPGYYSLARTAVYPGIGAGASACSLFVLECMACETPCVRTNTSTEETVDGQSGYLFEPDDEKAMQDAILKLLADEPLAHVMGKNARQAALKKYTWDSVIDAFLAAFKKHLRPAP